MQKELIMFGLMFIHNILSAEGRVFCQDAHAAPWAARGHTCPVICASVLDAIHKLIMMDYKKSIREQIGGHEKQNKGLIGYENEYYDTTSNLRRKSSAVDLNNKGVNNFKENYTNINYEQDVQKSTMYSRVENKGIKYYNKYKIEGISNSDVKLNNANDIVENIEYFDNNDDYKVKNGEKNKVIESGKNNLANDENATNNKINVEDLKIIQNVKDVKEILRRSYSYSQIEVNTTKYDFYNIKDKGIDKCWFLEKFKEKLLIGKVVRRKCGRRSNFDAKFVSVMTNVLNKYVDTVFRFTDEMTELLLENIFGKNTDLRNNIFDVNKLLNYLRKSVDKHKIHSHKHVITLRPKHCLTVAMPGCICKSGFVENLGQCVKPEDCVNKEDYLQYITRIIVL